MTLLTKLLSVLLTSLRNRQVIASGIEMNSHGDKSLSVPSNSNVVQPSKIAASRYQYDIGPPFKKRKTIRATSYDTLAPQKHCQQTLLPAQPVNDLETVFVEVSDAKPYFPQDPGTNTARSKRSDYAPICKNKPGVPQGGERRDHKRTSAELKAECRRQKFARTRATGIDLDALTYYPAMPCHRSREGGADHALFSDSSEENEDADDDYTPTSEDSDADEYEGDLQRTVSMDSLDNDF